jgi:hypothetical protein
MVVCYGFFLLSIVAHDARPRPSIRKLVVIGIIECTHTCARSPLKGIHETGKVRGQNSLRGNTVQSHHAIWHMVRIAAHETNSYLLGVVSSQVITLSNFNTLLPQKAVRGNIVEEEIGNGEIEHILFGDELHFAAASWEDDFCVF